MLNGLSGTYQMTVDSKGRVTLPAPFRKQLAGETSSEIKLVSLNGCLNGYTPEGFKEMVNGLFERDGRHFDPRNRQDVALKRGMYGAAVTIEVDSAGRIALGKVKQDVRDRLGLSGDVSIVGVDDHFEVWSAESYEAEQESFEANLDALLYGEAE